MSLLEVLNNIERNKRITGQLFFRLMGPSIELDLSNRDLFVVVGNIAVPKDSFKDEHQYAIAGYESHVEGPIIGIDKIHKIDFKKKFHGFDVGGILTEPIWRI